MKLRAVVETSKRLTGTRSRLEKVRLLKDLLQSASPAEIPLVVAYLSGRTPQSRLGIGHATLASLRNAAGAAESALELADVDATLSEIERIAGAGSSARFELVRQLLARATKEEGQFLAGLLLGDLRQGSLEGLMVEAVAAAAALPAESVRRALMFSGDLGLVARVATAKGGSGLAELRIELFRPVRPMLAQTAEDVTSALETLGTAALEWKLDGARIQVHKRGSEVRVFTRRLNDVTEACPEVVERVSGLPAGELVLDGEAIALRKDGRPHPFQTTMRRFGRKLDVASMRRALPLTSLYFDLLYREGEMLVDRPAEERFRALEELLPEDLLVPRLVTGDSGEAARFVREALEAGHEGAMAKALDAPYEAGSRGKAWLKVKSAHTLDLVVLAAEWGSGRRRGWLSNLHLGARDPESGGFVMLGKTFKGMTDEVLAWQTERLQELELSRDRWTVVVRPELVAEIAFNDLQRSPHYPGGLALRFARLKGYRHDKGPGDADTIDRVREMYEQQTGEKPGRTGKQLSFELGE